MEPRTIPAPAPAPEERIAIDGRLLMVRCEHLRASEMPELSLPLGDGTLINLCFSCSQQVVGIVLKDVVRIGVRDAINLRLSV